MDTSYDCPRIESSVSIGPVTFLFARHFALTTQADLEHSSARLWMKAICLEEISRDFREF